MAVFKKQDIYWIDYYVHGRRKRERIGPDKRLAEVVLRKRQVSAEGKYLDKRRVPRCTFNELAALYLPRAQTNHRSYVGTKSRVTLLREIIGDRQLTRSPRFSWAALSHSGLRSSNPRPSTAMWWS